ncbi:MAG: terminase small subunit [Longimicrobiales bacterium]
MAGKRKAQRREKLTPKQDRFVDRYLIDLNATRSYQEVYQCAEKVARANGPRLIGNPKVAAAIAREREARSKRTQVSKDWVVERLRRIAAADIKDFYSWDSTKAAPVPSEKLTPEQSAAVSEVHTDTVIMRQKDGTVKGAKVKTRLKLHDQVAALKLLGQHLGMFAQKHEHSGPDGGAIPVEVQELSDEELIRRAQEQASRLAAIAVKGNGRHGNGNGRRNGRKNRAAATS